MHFSPDEAGRELRRPVLRRHRLLQCGRAPLENRSLRGKPAGERRDLLRLPGQLAGLALVFRVKKRKTGSLQ